MKAIPGIWHDIALWSDSQCPRSNASGTGMA
jgi:hypothetical protein